MNDPHAGPSATPPSGSHILVVEDEDAIADGLVFNLQRKGYRVDLARDGRRALELVTAGHYDAVILDIRLPEIDGFDVCQRLRSQGNFTPILMLTARTQPDDVVYGLKLGADDYVTKPFDLAELLARVEGLLRRQGWQQRRAEPTAAAGPGEGAGAALGRYEFGDYWVDFRTWQAQTRQGLVELSRRELAAMALFCSKPNQVISRRELLAEVWELPNHPNERVVDNVIVTLRRWFEESAWRPRHIVNVRGVGYRFVP
ncbi:MAG: response regulator transcription factor [Vicinamibacterales bacterium]